MSTQWDDNIVIAELSDEPALSEELATIIERTTPPPEGSDSEDAPETRVPHVVLNFGQVSYVNSSNLAQLLKLRKNLSEGGRQLRLCSVNDDVWQILMVTGLDKVFRFAPDPLTALAGLQLEDAKEG